MTFRDTLRQIADKKNGEDKAILFEQYESLRERILKAAENGKYSLTVYEDIPETIRFWLSHNDHIKFVYDDGSPEEGNLSGPSSYTFSW